MATQPKGFLTPEQYLEIERQAEYKSEYYDGEMFAKAGAPRLHSLIVANVIGELRQQLKDRPCETRPSDLRVQTPSGLYTYPDVVVACGEARFLGTQEDTLLDPTLLVEVLSPSTEAYDRGRKFEHYRSIESLAEYLLVASDRIHADLFVKQPDGEWLLRDASRIEDKLELRSAGCSLALAEIYAKVKFTSTPPDIPTGSAAS
jgi:Uma2 family endonuclease